MFYFRNEEKITTLTHSAEEMKEKLQDNEQDLSQLHERERELLSINKEISESIVALQNEICLLKSEVSNCKVIIQILIYFVSEFS